MKFLFLGTLEAGSTSLQRARALSSLAAEFHGVDTRTVIPEYTERKWWDRAFIRLGSPHLVRRQTRLLVEEAARFQPDCVWIDQGLLVSREAIDAVRANGCNVVVHYTPDAIEAPGMSRTIQPAIVAYDLVITTKDADVQRYDNLGARRVFLSYQGFDPEVHRPLRDDSGQSDCDVVFVGQRMTELRQFLERLATELPEIDLRIYGRGWKATGALARAVRDRWLKGDDYARAIANARIALCFLNTEVGDEYTTRSFEIPACETFMLAQWSKTHEQLFEADEEAAFFRTEQELIDKVRDWLDDEPQRAKAARLAYQKVLARDWTWKGRMRDCLTEIDAISNR